MFSAKTEKPPGATKARFAKYENPPGATKARFENSHKATQTSRTTKAQETTRLKKRQKGIGYNIVTTPEDAPRVVDGAQCLRPTISRIQQKSHTNKHSIQQTSSERTIFFSACWVFGGFWQALKKAPKKGSWRVFGL